MALKNNGKEAVEVVEWDGPGLRRAGHIPPYTEKQKREWIKCAQDPIYFIEKYWKITHPDRGLIYFPLRPFQKDAIRAYTDHRMVAMLCSRQVGKAQSLKTPIITPFGMKTLGDIHVGDIIYGADGKPTKVLYESPVYTDRTCYNITFDNGEVVTADAEHLWTIGRVTQVRIPGTYKLGPEVKKNEKTVKYDTLTTEQIIPILEHQKAKGQSVFIDITKPLDMEHKEIPIDPYLFGLWLGDGDSRNGYLTGLIEDIEHYQEKLPNEKFFDFYQKNYNLRRVKIEGLSCKLRDLGVIKNKHIPDIYMFSSVEQRLALVQGLMDTDGSVVPKGSGEFYTKYLHLAQQFQTLLASLGIKSKIRSKTISKLGDKPLEPRDYYIVRFLTILPVTTLPRKAARLQTSLVSPDSQRHYIQSIEKVETVPVKCIQVDNEDHLFLCGNSLIPTHNTSVTAAFIGWFINFNPNVSVGVLADKQETAIEIHDRLKLGYENIPQWLKHGYHKWNVKSIKLENGSSVQVSATTINAGRGRSFSIVFLDEFAAVKKQVADKFKASIIPTIAAGTETKLFITSTPQGKNHFYKIVKEAEAGNNWHLIKADYRADPARDNEEWVQTQIKELGYDMFRQEHLCLAGETKVTIKDPFGKVRTLPIEEVHAELISRYQSHLIQGLNYYIQTPTGFQSFCGVQRVERPEYIRVSFEDGTSIRCSTNHRFQKDTGFVEALELEIGDALFANGSNKIVSSIALVHEKIFLYDPLNVAGGNVYFSDDLISHNCDFVGSTQTLIHPDKLRLLIPKGPVLHNPVSIYEKPAIDHQYVMLCDCAEGVGLDYSALQVLDVTSRPYKQVAAYHNNQIKPYEFAYLIKDVANIFNNAFVFIEDASTGPLVTETLFSLEYKNIITLEKMKGKETFKILLGRNSKGKFGGKTTLQVKLLGCTELKKLIEKDELFIFDQGTIEELESYCRQGASYAAEEGNNDDLVTCLMLFGWLYTNREFRLMLDSSTLTDEAIKLKAETYQILNFMKTLNKVESFEANGVLWQKIST